MFGNSQNSSYTCEYAIDYESDVVFGQNCVKSEQIYIESLVSKLNIQNPEDIPSCDVVCEELGDHQINYDEFISISPDTLESFCDASDNCYFNVSVNYDYEYQLWRREDGSIIDDIIWSNSGYPQYKDLVTLYLRPYSNPAYMVETGPRKDRKVREEPTADFYHFHDNRTGYYLFAEDEITNQLLKQGSYAEALIACTKIFTPQGLRLKLAKIHFSLTVFSTWRLIE